MAKPNYQYEKRQRELAKKAKKAEKAARKATGGSDHDDPDVLNGEGGQPIPDAAAAVAPGANEQP